MMKGEGEGKRLDKKESDVKTVGLKEEMLNQGKDR